MIKGTRQLDLSIDYSTAEEIKANAEAEREYRQMLESNGPIGTLSYGLSSDGIRFMQFYRLGEPRTRRLYYYGQGSGKDKKYVSWDEIAQLRFNQNTKRVEIHHRNKTVHDISIYDLYLRTDASKYERLYRQDTIRFVARIGEDRWAWSDVQVQEIQSIVFYGPSRWEHLKNQRLTTKDPSVP